MSHSQASKPQQQQTETFRALRISEIAKDLQVSPATIRELIKSGDLPAFRIRKSVRVRAEDVKAFIARKMGTLVSSEG